MLILVQIDISKADLPLFDHYEDQVLALLGNHAARVIERLRSSDSQNEVHLLHFPSQDALDAFRNDPARIALQDIWLRCGASSIPSEVVRLN